MERKVFTIRRTIRFVDCDLETVNRFISLYDHLFYHVKDKDAWNHNGYKIIREPDHVEVWFTMKKDDFENMVKNLGLVKYSTQEWIYA